MCTILSADFWQASIGTLLSLFGIQILPVWEGGNLKQEARGTNQTQNTNPVHVGRVRV